MLLELSDLDVFYGDAQALFNLSASVEEGRSVAFIGANGAGKSTILRTIAGISPALRGRVIFAGVEITHEAPHLISRRGVALVPEGRRLFPTLTAEENLMIGSLSGRKGYWTLGRVYDLFPAIREFRQRLPSQISGGQQQMVSIGRALLSNPRLLLCDELSLGLAPKVIGEIYKSFERIRTTGVSIVLVEQDIVRARAASDALYCLLKGRVRLYGSSRDLAEGEIAEAYFGSSST
jgi:branched-chain amino acid transport system ATP-binding protein